MNDKSNSEYRHILKYTSLFGGIQGIVMTISLVRNKFMALLIGTDGVGFNALLLSVQNFASQCTNMGISFGAVPRLSEYYEKQHPEMIDYYIQIIRLWSLIAAALGFLFCLFISPWMNAFSFTWGDHTLHYAFLAFAVALSAITGGETAILKATREIGHLARVQVYTAIVSVLISVPLYYMFHQSGVVPAIVLTAFLAMLVTVAYSYRCRPLRLKFTRSHLKHGASMIKLGTAFVLSAAIGSATEMLIRVFLNVEGSLNDVGLYNVGYMLTISYAGIAFSAMDSDYFPRLSAVNKDIAKTNEMANKQMEVSLLLLAPMLVLLLSMLPVLVPILFTDKFMPVVGMAQIAVLAMYFKVITVPISYITLARSRSLSYLFLETSYFVVLLASIIVCYRNWGILGTGMAIVIAHVAELLIVGSYAYWQYGYRFSSAIVHYAFILLSIGLVAFVVSLLLDGWLYWTTEAALTLVSTAYSVYILRQKTHLWNALMRKFRH